MTNAKIYVTRNNEELTVYPCTWCAKEIVEGYELYEQLYWNNAIVDWDLDYPYLDIVFDENPEITSRVIAHEELGFLSSAKDLNRLLGV